MRSKEQREMREDFLAARNDAAVINYSAMHPKRTVDPRDLMLTESGERTKPERSQQVIADELRRNLMAINKANEDRAKAGAGR